MNRVDRLRALMDEFGQTPDDYDEGEEEDPRPYFNGEREPKKWACVTVNYSSHGEAKHFFYTLPTLRIAKFRAGDFANDDIFEEIPVAVVDLDSGDRWNAKVSTKWTKWEPGGAT
jgi:hypothetical protein